ncbi:M48 family metallopeptidase [Nocardia cyriacigeorgica]|nr:M48 family metallopeptidase [Nocardia cyriacigeorgica]MBF6093933.1 M48 family metallopeptidase [Nocardia cyriacigeorgica]
MQPIDPQPPQRPQADQSGGQPEWLRKNAPQGSSSGSESSDVPQPPQSAPPTAYPAAPYQGMPPGYPTAGYPAYGSAPVPPAVPPARQPRGLSPFGMPARHLWEIPLLIVVVALTALAYLFAALLLVFGNVNEYILALVFAPILIWFGRGVNYATQRVNGVKMSPTQFPEGYRMVQEAAARFGMAKAPDAYVVLGNGQINAFASGHGFRRFVVVYSDLFEIGGTAREPDALAFIIGHEVGHIAAGHTSYWRQLGMFLVPFLPIIGSSLIRSQEYTADNHGFCNRHEGARAAMGTLAAGKYMNTMVGFDEMADRAAQEKGFFVWIVNALSTHPVLTWRMWALRDRSRHGRLFWRPSPPPQLPPGQHPYGPYGEVPSLPPKPVA